MSKITAYILAQQELGNNLLEMESEMNRLNESWEAQNSDPNAESEAEKILGRTEEEFNSTVNLLPF